MLVRRHKSDRIIGVLTVVLLAIGLIVIYAIGPMRANVMNAAYGTVCQFDGNLSFQFPYRHGKLL